MACVLFGPKRLPQPRIIVWSLDSKLRGNCYQSTNFFIQENAFEILSAKRRPFCPSPSVLTHWGRVTHICFNKLTIIGSDNGLSPGRRQAIIWTNAGILLIRTLGTYFNEILIEIHTVSFKEMRLKMSSGKWRPFCLGLNVLNISL